MSTVPVSQQGHACSTLGGRCGAKCIHAPGIAAGVRGGAFAVTCIGVGISVGGVAVAVVTGCRDAAPTEVRLGAGDGVGAGTVRRAAASSVACFAASTSWCVA